MPRILLVDDDPLILDVFSGVLRQEGYEVLRAQNAEEALSLAGAKRPELVLLDVCLPDRNGIEVCKAIKQDSSMKDVCVALISGEATGSSDKLRGAEIGADDYLTKPFDSEELLARVRTLLRLRNTTAALRASEEYYRKLIAILPDAVLLINLQGCLLSVNPRAVTMFGCGQDSELLDQTIFNLAQPKEHERLRASIAGLVACGHALPAEFTLLRKNGERFPAEISVAALQTASQHTLTIVALVRDLTSHKRSEQQRAALTELGYRLSGAVTALQAAEIILDVANNVFGWDAGYVHLYSEREHKIVRILTVDTIEGKRTRVADQASDAVPTPLMRLVMSEGGMLLNRSAGARLPVEPSPFGDQSRRSAAMMYAPIHSGRAVIGILSVQSYSPGAYSRKDLALLEVLADHCGGALERIKMTQALSEAEARFHEMVEKDRRLTKAILDNISDPAWLKDAHGHFLACNEAYARLVQREPAAIMGRTVKDLQLEVARQLASEDADAMRTRRSIRFDHQQTDSEGRKRWFEAIISPLLAANGEVTGTAGIARDITLRKIFEGELRHLPRRITAAQEAERLRVSRELHDGVNQLLASTQMRLRRVQDSLPDRPAAREILSRCHDLLTQALEENRRIAHDLRPSELDQLGLAAACRHLLKGLKLRAKFAVHCRIIGLPERLEPEVELNLFRIIQEALNNVEKHAGASRVALHITARGGVFVAQVKDDGRGFELIRSQAAGGKTRGIGLTNMTDRAAAIGGTCEIETAPQKGTVVRIRVPLKRSARPARK